MKKYKIAYKGILEQGYVVLKWNSKEQYTNEPATIFRLKFVADFFCYILNKNDRSFTVFKVVIHE